VLRKKLYPTRPAEIFRRQHVAGITRWKPFLSGASMIRVGWHHPAKLLIYPIRDNIDAQGRQLVNWVCDIENAAIPGPRDWNRRGGWKTSCPAMADWNSRLARRAGIHQQRDAILEYSDGRPGPVARWSFGRLTLLGDAAHPMYPRGANGSAQAILDLRALSDALKAHADPVEALKVYEGQAAAGNQQGGAGQSQRAADGHPARVFRRTGDKPFTISDDVISTTNWSRCRRATSASPAMTRRRLASN